MMGYSGLNCIFDSDNASDFTAHLMLTIANELTEHLKDKGDTNNTPGYVDVALIFEEIILPAAKNSPAMHTAELVGVARECSDLLDVSIAVRSQQHNSPAIRLKQLKKSVDEFIRMAT